MIRTEETEVLRLRIAAIKDKIALKEEGYFDFGTTLEHLKDSLEEAENELQGIISGLGEKNIEEDFELSE